MINVILSGGVGSRLWPLSRKSQPKQYIPLFEGKCLFQLTVERNLSLCNEVLVVGNRDNQHLSAAVLEKFSVEIRHKAIIEATPRNTAAAIAFAAFSVPQDTVLLVTPSDQIITNAPEYSIAVKRAVELAEDDFLVTFGIRPFRPETGYGYIQHQEEHVLSFHEKPDWATAASFLEKGNYLWNSGMFCFKAGIYLQELSHYEPEIFSASQKAWLRGNGQSLPLPESRSIPSSSIDNAVMERSDRIRVVPANFGWSDLGSFESIWDHWEGQGEKHHFRNNNCVVGSEKHVEFLGVENLVLVETHDAILVLDRSKSQDVKKIYNRLEEEKPELIG